MILIIASQKRMAKELNNIFRLRGIIAKRYTPIEALCHIQSSVSAILLLYPEALPDKSEYINALSSIKYNIPLFAITRSREELAPTNAFAEVIDEGEVSGKILETIHRTQERLMCRFSGSYRLLGIDASVTLPTVTFRGNSIRLTKSETAILRFMICSYPNNCLSEKIASQIYPEGHVPEPSCIRAHICAINKKFSPFLSSPLIQSTRCEGYHFNQAILTEN